VTSTGEAGNTEANDTEKQEVPKALPRTLPERGYDHARMTEVSTRGRTKGRCGEMEVLEAPCVGVGSYWIILGD